MERIVKTSGIDQIVTTGTIAGSAPRWFTEPGGAVRTVVSTLTKFFPSERDGEETLPVAAARARHRRRPRLKLREIALLRAYRL
jgi:hypothetical protein